MKDILKKDRMACLSIVSGVITIAAIIFYAVLAMDGEKSSAQVYLLAVAAIVMDGVILLLASRSDLIVTIAGWVAAILTAAALMTFVRERVQWLYAVFSKMEAAPITALFPATIIVFAIAIVAQLLMLFGRNTAE